MWEKTLPQRFALIGIVVLVAIWLIYPPREKLRGGLDIEGGVSMIFEIQEEPGENNPYLAESMKRLLQKRVDPGGVLDLKWRVLGRNRLEVQMPLPPEENKRLREEFIRAREALLATNVRRGELEEALRLPAEERAAALERLAGGDAKRRALLEAAAGAYDEWRQALEAYQQAEAAGGGESVGESGSEPATQPGMAELRVRLRDAEEAWMDAMTAVREANFDDQRFQEVLELEQGSPRRESSLKALYEQYPLLEGQIRECVARHDAWRAQRAYLESPADLRRLLRGAGVLEFRILAEPAPDNPTQYDRYREQLQERGPRRVEGEPYQWFPIDNPLAFFNLNSPAELANYNWRAESRFVVEKREDKWYVLAKYGPEHGLLHARSGGAQWRLKRAYATRDRAGRRAVGFTLDPIGGAAFGKLTGANIDKQLCIFVDDVAYSSATIRSRITTEGIIEGEFSAEKIGYLIQTLEAGSLPARLKDTPLSERTIGSNLGHENLRKALRSGIVGLIAVVALMAGYYLLGGMVANAALLLNVLMVLAVMAMLGARFTLAGIAGVVLTIGMSVDANVLIFERMREEKARGASLRMIIKNGYDKAFSTIFDSNVTTLLTAVIIYYVGSEEIKGFGLTLGWGIVTSLFTALFVTRTVFTALVKYNLLKDIRMLQAIGVPNIDWYAKRKLFIPLSIATSLIGLALLYGRGKRDALDVEFLGGVNAEVALKSAVAGQYDDVRIQDRLREIGRQIREQGRRLADARVTPLSGAPGTFRVEVPDVPADRLAAMIAEPLEANNLILRGGVEARRDENAVIVRGSEQATLEKVQDFIRTLAGTGEFSVPLAGDNIGRANVGLVTETGGAAERGRYWNITTTETNKALVQHALVAAFGDDLDIQPRIAYTFRGQPVPIERRRLAEVIRGLPPEAGGDLTDYLGGAALFFDELSPPQPVDIVRDRLRNMRLQPDYQDLPWREFEVIGVRAADADGDGQPDADARGQRLYAGLVIVVADPRISYEVDREAWLAELAQPELNLARATFDQEQTLRKVTQFKPEVAAQSQTRASLALVLSWAMMIGYLWVRFGRARYGIASVVALIHDVCIALAFVGISGWIGGAKHPIGNALLISDFKIDMTIVAAFLTIIGYSVNDTIVVFDRIREMRGRLGIVTPQIINQAINQTLSRTLLTGVTTLVVLLVMYILGGSSIRGFNFCMIIGVLTGTYSSIAIAAPVLLMRLVPQPVPASAR